MSPEQRLADLAQQYDLPPGAPGSLMRLLELVAAEPQALTTVRDRPVAVEVHVADSLSGLVVPALRAARVLADLGSGGGFPGLVLALALPRTRVVLVESTAKKAAFLERAAAELELANVAVEPIRVEEWRAGLGTCDVVTARALAPLGVLLEYAAPLLIPSGTLIAWKGRRDPGEEADAVVAAEALGMSPPLALPVEPGTIVGAHLRHLDVSSKVGVTPTTYPRRPGMARKRPFRASAGA